MEKYLLIKIDRFANFQLPAGWLDSDWQNVTRDHVLYKMAVHIDDLPDNFKNQADYCFETKSDYLDWMNSTDIIPTVFVTIPISNHKQQPILTRTATALNFTGIDMQRNGMGLTLGIKSYNGTIEQKQLYREFAINITGAFYGVFMAQMNSSLTISEVIANIIREKDLEGAL